MMMSAHHMDMKVCIGISVGMMMTGVGMGIDRPAEEVPSYTQPSSEQSKPVLPTHKPARLGIVPAVVPGALVAQLELNGFPGVLVNKVLKDSPAAKVGLQENDVIVKLGDVNIDGPASVSEALAEKKPGDEMTVVYYRKGKKESLNVTLDEGDAYSAENALADSLQMSPDNSARQLSPFQSLMPGNSMAFPGHSSTLRMGRASAAMQQLMDDLMRGDMFDDPFFRGQLSPNAAQLFDTMKQLQQQSLSMPPVGKVASSVTRGGSSVFLSDGNGSIIIKSDSDNGTMIKVTDRTGKVLYSGPYNTPEEKEAVPAEIKPRLKNLNVNFCF